jgi:hypothetical protein
MKIRTASQFTYAIGDEFSWRHKELLDYRLLTRTSNDIVQRALIRAGVPLAYAHWEGFVKSGTELLLNFVNSQNLDNKTLADAYYAHSVKIKLTQTIESLRASAVIEAASFIRNAADKKAEIRHKNYVDTGSNLSSDVFEQIAGSVGIDTRPYKYLYPYIDETIVNNRNQIAHGEHLQLKMDDFHALVDRVADLIRAYKNDLENVVALKSYLLV